MPTLAAPARSPLLDQLAALVRSRWLWCLAATAFVVLREIGGGMAELVTSLGDTDDATRLLQVREFMAGAGWYDTTLNRIGGPTPLASHWSRLIDLPIALLLGLFGLLMSPAATELTVRILWPAILLCVFLRILAHEVEARGGETAAVLFLVFAVTCLSGLFQFRAGRIDHHNAMILGAIGGLLVLARALEVPKAGWTAGLLMGYAVAVGYEPLALLLPLVGIAALAATVHTPWLAGARNMALALAASLLVGFLLAVPPSRWLVAACDALSINMVLLVGAGAAGIIVIASRADQWSLPHRLAALAATAVAAVALYVAADPVCLGGPYGQVSAEAKRLWLSNVSETQSIFAQMPQNPTPYCVFLIFVAAGIAAAVLRWRRHGDTASGALAVLMLVSIMPALWQVKFVPYASWLAAVTISLWVAELGAIGELSALSSRLLGAMALNQSSLALLVAPLLLLGGTSKAAVEGKATVDMDVCRETPPIRALGKLPAGFVVSQVDLGPYIAALTHHDVLSAPYHRIDTAIVTTHAIFKGAPADAEARLKSLKAVYLVACIPPAKTGRPADLDADVPPSSLQARLSRGEPVAFLAEVEKASTTPNLRVWRVVPTARKGE